MPHEQKHPVGVIYLLHFERPFKHAKHYIGWTQDLEGRLADHAAGAGARLMAVVSAAAIGFQLARTWSGTKSLERRIKTLGGASRCCPICSPRHQWGSFSRGAA